jgi:hypothetical protein
MSLPVGPSSSPYQHFIDYDEGKTKKLNFDITAMRDKALVFSKNDSTVFEYINAIMENSDFQKNPQVYLEVWSERRESSQIAKYPEDYARPFFDEYFQRKRSDCLVL